LSIYLFINLLLSENQKKKLKKYSALGNIIIAYAEMLSWIILLTLYRSASFTKNDCLFEET